MWRKALLLEYLGLLIPLFFNLRSTVGETVFVSFEVEKMRMFLLILVQSIVRWYWVLVRSWGAVVSFPM